ncbi:deaminase [Sphingomonas donggukensis]|uniref:Deaminase n=1 Tax=Sphingomonas donggukensis TaxID=2949093 RepID=A0ABY4TQV7_9SPHN|nr:deaminase [Sphingomonas donggukensis]URW74750.1 deaminase [Sphingomonas donggukensis]
MAIKDKAVSARPDLYVGLVCAAGTDLSDLKDQIQAQLSVVGYDIQIIKVSNLIKQIIELPHIDDEYYRMKALMRGGDCIREASEGGNGVASAIVSEIRRLRNGSELPQSTAYVIDSLKSPYEISLLDQIYGRNFYSISVFKPQSERTDTLSGLIAKKRHQPPGDEHRSLANDLIKEDEKGSGKKAQNVQSTFPKADFFVNGSQNTSSQIERFIKIIFGQPFETPTLDEYAMFMARGSALRSCDLSRQVGVAIVDQDRSILATGFNDVPYPGGGVFLPEFGGKIGDNRDFKEGHDPNYIEIQRTLIEFIKLLQSVGHVDVSLDPSTVADGLLHGEYKELTSNVRIRNLIEFGRVVHAEMHAISQAASSGRSVKGASLYSTTFPCHGCARHIISSGISEVVFIEPYPKSMTFHLYGKEIEMVSDRSEVQSPDEMIRTVKFRPFYGVAPQLYMRAFTAHERKNQYGTIATWLPKTAVPVGAVFGVERPKTEVAAAASLASVAKRAIKLFAEQSQTEGADNGAQDTLGSNGGRQSFFSKIFQGRAN